MIENKQLKPLCFVLMPFGVKPDGSGRMIDFDAVYSQMIKPAIEEAGLEPVRADEETVGGMIHKPMFERLVMCEYAVADLTTANANVFYELGVRHAARPWTTVLIFADGARLPFDVGPLRGLQYALDQSGSPDDAGQGIKALSDRLKESRDKKNDSPVFQFIEGMQEQQLDREKTDLFRDEVEYSIARKKQLASARSNGLAAVQAVESELDDLQDVEAGVLVDLLLSYRAVKGFEEMKALTARMPRPLQRLAIVQEQYGFALNRLEEHDVAESVLTNIIRDHGPSSETYGLLGRVYKDQWELAKTSGSDFQAQGYLLKAIETYKKGFETDWRDAYPGINAVTLMEICEPPDPTQKTLLPVVQYSVARRLEGGRPDYWDYATQLELAVLAKDEEASMDFLARALSAVRESWEPETTERNLRLIREARAARGEELAWALIIENELRNSSERLQSSDADD